MTKELDFFRAAKESFLETYRDGVAERGAHLGAGQTGTIDDPVIAARVFYENPLPDESVGEITSLLGSTYTHQGRDIRVDVAFMEIVRFQKASR